MNSVYTVYKHTSPSGKVYIGITKQNPTKRWGKDGHGYKDHNPHFYSAIEKYGWEHFKHEILFTNLTKEEACEKEIELIAFYKSNKREFGYNKSSGGESTRGMLGKKHTLVTINKMKISRKNKYPFWLKGKPLSDEHKHKLKLALSGRKCTDETREKIRKSKLNISEEYRSKLREARQKRIMKSPSEETRKKLSAACKHKKRVIQFDLEGNFIKIWDSMKQIEKTLNIYSSNISKCCSGKHKTYKKYIWKLESEVLKNE